MKVKFCGLTRIEDIVAVNELKPEFIGFVFYSKSKRYITFEKARELKNLLNKQILAVGVFVNSPLETVLTLLNENIIDIAQLHGEENENYIKELKKLTQKPVIKAFKIQTAADIELALKSPADYILLDAGAGEGKTFNWNLIKNIHRAYFLAGGLDLNNLNEAIKLKPYALDLSSGIETEGIKDKYKMQTFIKTLREAN